MDQKKISEAVLKQIAWLQTWRTKKGAYNGFVVHRNYLKRMFKTHDTPWSQGPIISGYLNLYRKTKDKRWLQEAIAAADLQCTRLHKSGKYIYAGFEDDRFSSLVHNSLANCALLDLAQLLSDEGDKGAVKYLEVGQKNIDQYIIGILWDKNFGAFKFSKIDYYSPHVTRFVINMNSVAVESFIKLSTMTNEKKYEDYAIRVGEWMLTEQIKSAGIEHGGINYSQVEPRILIAIYTALAMRGIDDLYILTKDHQYLEMMRNAAEHLVNVVDPETRLFYHAILDGKLCKYPQFIAGSGIILKALDDAQKLTGEKFEYQNTIDAILDRQLPHGGFPSFIGYRNKKLIGYRNKSDEFNEVWEDKVPVVGWNAHLFEFLTRMIPGNFIYKISDVNKICVATQNYVYRENSHSVLILGIKPIRSIALLVVLKKTKVALIYMAIHQLEKLLISILPAHFKNRIKEIFIQKKST